MVNIKKIKEFFNPKPPKLPFDKDENGRDIYYLWYRGGEAFVINNESQKKALERFYYSVLIFFASGVLSCMFLEFMNVISNIFFYYSIGIINILASIVYIFFMYLKKQSMSIHALSLEESRPQKEVFFIWLWMISPQFVILQPLILPTTEKNLEILAVLSVFYFFFITHFCFKLHKTKGHYFSG